MMEKIDLLPFDYFKNGNSFSGSRGEFNYKIIPKGSFKAVVWYGKNCCDKSEIVAEHDGEITEQVYEETILWINESYRNFTK